MNPIKKFTELIRGRLLGKQLDFRVRLFNVLAMAGIVVSLISTIACIANSENLFSIFANFATSIIALGIMVHATRTGHYQFCYMLTIVIIFFAFFPFIFFVGGGYHGAMPFFFIFAIVFTVFMLEGKIAVGIALTELFLYLGLCGFAYFNPNTVTFVDTALYEVTDIVIGFSTVSIALGVTMFLHFRLYRQQQTELEAAQKEALRLSEVKSNFLSNMSHEIRTPINVMLGMNEMIARTSQSDQVKDYVFNIENAGKMLLLLINNILDISKIESGHLAIVPEVYQTSDLIDMLEQIGAELADSRGLRFQIGIDEALPRALVGDCLHIQQIASNFLSNAAKYTEEGGVALSFENKPAPDGITLCISVADTGFGIKKENIPYLFDAFTRADLPANRNIEGTGLGLAIAKELAEQMGGKIYVTSEWGKGSVFSVEIPQMIQDAEPMGKRRKSKRADKGNNTGFIAPGGRILVVDDNAENLQVIKALLARTMLSVDTAGSGAECLEAAQNFRYDIILLDYMMPDMDGLETLTQLKKIPEFGSPVIALTANVVTGTKKKLLDAGFCEYLSKPIMSCDLENALRTFLPAPLIAEIAAENVKHDSIALTPELQDKLTNVLAAYGVTLSDGLKYLDGDMGQYREFTVIFTKNYESGRREIEELAGQEDWDSLKFPIHSLKSKALAVGANALSETAAKLQKLCEVTDGAYIKAAMPMLYHEWERTAAGLSVFTSLFAEVGEYGE